MKKTASPLTLLALVLITFFSFSALGLALIRDVGGAYHLSWSSISTTQPLPATGVISVAATPEGSFMATVKDPSTGKNQYYLLDPTNISAGWQSCDPPTPTAVSSITTSELPFAYGYNTLETDKIPLPDGGLFEKDYKIYNESWTDNFCELLIYNENALIYCSGCGPYRWCSWPATSYDLIESSAIDRTNPLNPYLQTFPVFYTFHKKF